MLDLNLFSFAIVFYPFLLGSLVFWFGDRASVLFRLYFFQILFLLGVGLLFSGQVPELPFANLLAPGLIALHLPVISLIIVWMWKRVDLSKLMARLRAINWVTISQALLYLLMLKEGHFLDPLGRAPLYFFGFLLLPWLMFPLFLRLPLSRQRKLE